MVFFKTQGVMILHGKRGVTESPADSVGNVEGSCKNL